MRGGGERARPQRGERPSTSLVFTLAALLAPRALGLYLLIGFLTGDPAP